MAATANDRDTIRKSTPDLASYPVKAATKIPLLTLNAIDPTGHAVPGSDTAGLKNPFVSKAGADNSSGSDGDMSVQAYRKGVFGFGYAPGDATIALIGSEVALVDNQTVDLTANTTNGIVCGVITEIISPSEVFIDIDRV